MVLVQHSVLVVQYSSASIVCVSMNRKANAKVKAQTQGRGERGRSERASQESQAPREREAFHHLIISLRTPLAVPPFVRQLLLTNCESAVDRARRPGPPFS